MVPPGRIQPAQVETCPLQPSLDLAERCGLNLLVDLDDEEEAPVREDADARVR